jgi:hypothetical protein
MVDSARWEKVDFEKTSWHDFLMVNKSWPDRPTKYGNHGIIFNMLKLLTYLRAHFVGNPVKNIVITEVGATVNNFIHISVNTAVDVHSQPLCRP